MAARSLDITPETKVGALLDAYPQLEEVLAGMAPAFSKLRNPVLRRTVAKVTSLRQAARVGNVPLPMLINTLRESAGQAPADLRNDDPKLAAVPPDWLDESKVTERLDARAMLAEGERPIDTVMPRLSALPAGGIFELTTPFEPAPLIDMAEQKGFATWHHREAPELVKTYFRRRPDDA